MKYVQIQIVEGCLLRLAWFEGGSEIVFLSRVLHSIGLYGGEDDNGREKVVEKMHVDGFLLRL